jgi:DNA invertase Pin-like site-specific DNA recombinase
MDWEFAGVYADDAVTGVKDTRPEFQRLLADCRGGKIDMVLTKSVTRFARNTVTTLETVRELNSLGVDVRFEKENIHSLSGDGELMLSILASYAQEESRSVSENLKWRLRNKFKDGRPNSTTVMGYKLVNGAFVIVPEEAETVRMVFADFLGGMGKNAIMKKLNALGVPNKRGEEWSETGVNTILRNVKYKGDLLLQKSFVENHVNKKRRVNKGELPMYYIENSHDPIIDRETFQRTQDELARRAELYSRPKKSLEPYRFTGKIVCGQCGKNYRRRTANAGSTYAKAVWVCMTLDKKGKAACASQQIPEDVLLRIVDVDFVKIRVPGPNTLVIVKPDGSEDERRWQHKPRSESWTDEKREKARAFEMERRKTNASSQKD